MARCFEATGVNVSLYLFWDDGRVRIASTCSRLLLLLVSFDMTWGEDSHFVRWLVGMFDYQVEKRNIDWLEGKNIVNGSSPSWRNKNKEKNRSSWHLILVIHLSCRVFSNTHLFLPLVNHPHRQWQEGWSMILSKFGDTCGYQVTISLFATWNNTYSMITETALSPN